MANPSIEQTPHYTARRRERMSRFLRILLAITVAMHVPVALGVAELARRLGLPSPWVVGLTWGVAGVGLFLGRARAGMPDRRRSETDRPSRRHSVLHPLVRGRVDHHPGGRADDRRAARSVASRPAGVATGRRVHVDVPRWARRMWIRRPDPAPWFRVVEHEVRIPGLDARFNGFRIAQLSDLHVGTLTPKSWAIAWSQAANARSPDVAVVTGDMVTSGTEFHEDIAEALGVLKAKMGVFASMGNHDYFGEGEPLVSLLKDRGIQVLRNEGRVIERDGAKLWLAAIDDTWTRRDDLELAMRDRPEGAATVLLAHDPGRFDQAAETGAELVLSGHTHGGQIAVPFLAKQASLAHLAHPYNVGFYHRGRSTLYVHPGLGTTGPPMRLGAAPEVAILVLRSG